MQVGSAASCLPFQGANSRCLGTYWYIFVHIGMFLVCIGAYWYDFGMFCYVFVCYVFVVVCIWMYWYILVDSCVYWYISIVTDLSMAFSTTERGGSYIQQRRG